MRRFLLLSLAILLGSIGLMAGYVMWDYDPDNVSPVVEGPSYQMLFEESVLRRMGKSYDQLDPAGKQQAIADILASQWCRVSSGENQRGRESHWRVLSPGRG